MVHLWLPRVARDALVLLRRPKLTALERSLAASLLATAIKQRLARGPVHADWISLIQAQLHGHDGDVVDSDPPDGRE